MQSTTSILAARPSVIRSISLSEGQRIEIEIDDGVVEIRHVESCDAVSGSVFVGADDVASLIAALRNTIRKSGGRAQ